ncbi:MAG: hypothetical protein WEB06_20655 [Actinomycetota bacterium]
MLEPVDFAAVRDRMISHPKPPVRARLVERNQGQVVRVASVVYDGEGFWYIDDGAAIELNSTGKFAVMVDGGDVIRHSGNVAANSWVKSMLAGHRLVGLDAHPFLQSKMADERGRIVGVEVVNGYECWVADVMGLKADQGVTFRLWVEPTAGFVVRLRRGDIDASVDAEEMTIGTRKNGPDDRAG